MVEARSFTHQLRQLVQVHALFVQQAQDPYLRRRFTGILCFSSKTGRQK